MIKVLAAIIACFAGLAALASFDPNALVIFGIGCGLIGLAVVINIKFVALLGIFELFVLSPFALEYTSVAHEVTMLAALLLATLPASVLVAVALDVGEKKRVEWTIDPKGVVAAAAVALLVFHSIFVFSLFGNLGEFLGDIENSGVQVLVLTFATALAVTLLLVPPRESPGPARE